SGVVRGNATISILSMNAPATTRLVATADSRLPPAHPDRQQDDGTKQVSWLPALSLSSAFPDLYGPSGSWTKSSPVTVAGAAAVSHRVPSPCAARQCGWFYVNDSVIAE